MFKVQSLKKLLRLPGEGREPGIIKILDAGLHRHDGQWWFPTCTVQLSFLYVKKQAPI